MFTFMRQQPRMHKLLITEYNKIRPTTRALAEVHIHPHRRRQMAHQKPLSHNHWGLKM